MSNKTGLRTDLARARGLGSAHDGVHHWWMQRISAVLLALVSIYLATQLGGLTPEGEYAHIAVISAIGDPITSIALILFIMTAFYHACLGVQVVIEDYVHCPTGKPLLLVASSLFFFILGTACVFCVLFIDFVLIRG